MNFSVLMSLYEKEKPEFFIRAVQSIWDEQSLKPSEIVLVLDGKLTSDLYSALETIKLALGNTLKIVSLETNVGLGKALNFGLEKCSFDLVARMDTDDIACPGRFEEQINVIHLQKVDVCGSWVSEFDRNEKEIVSVKRVPETEKDILSFSKLRNPMNHPSVMYKKSVVFAAGGYKHMPYFEDYYLWVRMLKNGAVFYNIQRPLVNMRVGSGQLERRRGRKYMLDEYNFFRTLLKENIFSGYEFFVCIIKRLSIRLLPKTVVKLIYSFLRK